MAEALRLQQKEVLCAHVLISSTHTHIPPPNCQNGERQLLLQNSEQRRRDTEQELKKQQLAIVDVRCVVT